MTSALTRAGSTRAWRRLQRYVLARDGYSCRVPVDINGDPVEDGDPATDRLCGARARCADHIKRRRDGGTDDLANLRAACEPCNLAREHLRPRQVDPGWSW